MILIYCLHFFRDGINNIVRELLREFFLRFFNPPPTIRQSRVLLIAMISDSCAIQIETSDRNQFAAI